MDRDNIDDPWKRLDDALQNILEYYSDSSDTDIANEDPSLLEQDLSQDDTECEEVQTKIKRRKIQNLSQDDKVGERCKEEIVLLLFDRYVNFSSLTSQSSLYSMARVWVKNHPHSPPASPPRNQVPCPINVPPTKTPYHQATLPQLSSRDIRDVLRASAEGVDLPSTQSLLFGNLKEWRYIRERWQKTLRERIVDQSALLRPILTEHDNIE